VIGPVACRPFLLLSALVNEKAFNYIISLTASRAVLLRLHPADAIGLLVGYRRAPSRARTRHVRLGRWRLPLYITALVVFIAVATALLFLPQFTSNKWVFLGVVAVAAAWWFPGLWPRLRSGDAGSHYAKTHLN
jgi:hypothetical protein